MFVLKNTDMISMFKVNTNAEINVMIFNALPKFFIKNTRKSKSYYGYYLHILFLVIRETL